MIDHDQLVGKLSSSWGRESSPTSRDTIVIYSQPTTAPSMKLLAERRGMTPFRGEKNTNWEGAFRVPAMVRWPGHIPAGEVLNGIVSHNDWFPTLLAAAGVGDIVGPAQGRCGPERYDVQGAPGRPQPARLHHGRCGREPTQTLLLRLRRRRPDGGALRQLEAGLPGAALPGHVADLGGAVHRAPGAVDLQPPDRPLRTGRASRRTPTTTGVSTTPSCSCRARRSCSR